MSLIIPAIVEICARPPLRARMTSQVIDGLHVGGDHPFTRAVAGVDHRKESP